MKTYKKHLKYIFLFLIILPLHVYAANITPKSVGVEEGQEKTITVACTDCEGKVRIYTSDSSIAEVVGDNVFWIDSKGVPVTIRGKKKGDVSIKVEMLAVADDKYEEVSGTQDLNVNITNNTTNNITNNNETNNTNNTTNNETNNITNNNNNGNNDTGNNNDNAGSNNSKSSNTNLTSLKVNGCTLSPAFSKSRTSYTCSDVNGDSISISATKEDSTSSIVGAGKRILKVGDNTLYVTVTAEDGTKKSYSIKVKRTNDSSTDNTLSRLEVAGFQIGFNKDKLEYDLSVSKDVDSIVVLATPTSDKAKVTGAGKIDLIPGDNKIVITVEASNGDTKTYIINCKKTDQDNVANNTLNKLTIDDKEIDLTGNPEVISVSLPKYQDKFNLDYASPSKTAKVEVIGSDNLKEGINKVSIKVSDDGLDDKIYTIYVYNPPKDAMVLNSLEDLKELSNLDKDVVFSINENDEHIIPDYIIDLLKSSDKKLIYNITDDNGGLLFSLELDKNSELEKGISFKFIKVEDNPLKYISNIPKGIKITAFVYGLYEDGTVLKSYKYDEDKNEYILLEDGVVVKDGYISFVSNGNSEYIFSDSVLKVEKTTVLGWLIRLLGVLCLIIIILLILLLIIKKRLRRKRLMQRKLEENRRKLGYDLNK